MILKKTNNMYNKRRRKQDCGLPRRNTDLKKNSTRRFAYWQSASIVFCDKMHYNNYLKLRTSKIDVQLEKSIVNAAKVTKSSSF